MKITNSIVYEGRNVHSHKKCIELEVDLEGYAETPSKDIKEFNERLIEILPILKTHRCGIDEEGGFVKRLYEGTYLSHICEHMIIGMQNILGIDVAYGKAREINCERYLIVYQYEYQKVALEVARLAVDLINSFIKNSYINFNERFNIIKNILSEELIGPSTLEICKAAKKKGMPILSLGNSGIYQIGYGKQGRLIEAAMGGKTSCIATDISCDKLLTKEILKIQNLPVAKGEKVSNVIAALKIAEEIGYPIVFKPQFGNKGKGVIVNIKNEKELMKAYQQLSSEYEDIFIEKYYSGDDYRVCVINYNVVAVSKRIPPYIVGDGKRTVSELIDEINNDDRRGEDHEKPLTKIIIDNEIIKNLEKNKLNINSVVGEGKKIVLRENSNLSTGGIAVDYTDIISEENKEICIRAAKAIGLDICGVDICTKDISKPLLNNGIILEVNAAPGLRMHVYPNEGIKRNVGMDIVNMLYNNEPKNIPVIAITGTNGKTTTTRIISHTLSRMGYCVGMTSTDGIYIDGKCIDVGDDTGVESAKCVLFNKDVEIAVLETARGGIIRKGLAYDLADVSVITNITDDHLGSNNVNTMEDLCKVKSLVAEAVKEDGYSVINADDKWSKEIIGRVKSNIIYYSMDYMNPLIVNNTNGISVYIKESCIMVNNKGREYKVVDIPDIPITLNGALGFNIENAMAACAALVGLNVDYSMIAIGLSSFKLNSEDNSGRFNIYDCNGVNIILDYGHNIEGYNKVLPALRNISSGEIIGIIGVPGDRSNYVAEEVGKLSATYLDKIIIKEDKEKRGRETGEVAELLLQGVLNKNKEANVRIILNEVEALEVALKEAKKGDSIIVFFESIDPLKKFIKANNNSESNLGNVVNSN